MKKILTVCLTVLAIFCFTGCGKGDANTSSSSPEAEQHFDGTVDLPMDEF